MTKINKYDIGLFLISINSNKISHNEPKKYDSKLK